MNREFKGITSYTLHLLAMAFMVCDHTWATLVPGNMWMTCIGRLTYPIFAFLLVEGFVHTRDFWAYCRRLLVFAVLSEIPFNLIYGASVRYPYHQNVLWTLLLSLLCLRLIDSARKSGKLWKFIPVTLAVSLAGWLIATVAMVDYYGAGVLTVILFYLCRGETWYHRLGQLIGLWWINCRLIGGLQLLIPLLGMILEVPKQGFALLALPILWLYRGEQGRHGRLTQITFYAFYPLHMLLLALLGLVF